MYTGLFTRQLRAVVVDANNNIKHTAADIKLLGTLSLSVKVYEQENLDCSTIKRISVQAEGDNRLFLIKRDPYGSYRRQVFPPTNVREAEETKQLIRELYSK